MNSGRTIMLGINANTVSLLAFGALCASAEAQTTLHKCVLKGKISYADAPCAEGAATTLHVPATVPDPAFHKRMASQQAYVKKLDELARKDAVQEERRIAQERRQGAAHRQKCAKLRLQKKWADEDLATAERKQAGGMRVKARRRAEEMALECPD
jgi:hypothetical protein